ncbi:MAG: pilin [Candidatus Moranbacteria bacterium]|nr:pilin [Candidatus Moranbacteria bacterium]
MKIKLVIGLFLLSIFLLVPTISLAVDGDYGSVNLAPANNAAGGLVPCGNGGVETACTLCHFVIGFQNLVNFMLKLVITMGFVGIFAAGVMYIISAGDDKMMGSAKSALTASLIGFGIVMGAWLIVNVTIWALGANIGVATGQNWYDFNCSTRSSTVPNSAPVVTAENCCVVGPGRCSHVKDSSECSSGTYKTGSCADIADCLNGGTECGIGGIGQCKSGVLPGTCPDGWSATMGNLSNPCVSGTKCCAKNGEAPETCAGGSGKCFYGSLVCPLGYGNSLGLCSASTSACCAKNGESTEVCAGGAGKCFNGTSVCPTGYTSNVGTCSTAQSVCCTSPATVAPGIVCGINSLGECKAGICPDNYSVILGSPTNPCPNGTNCCAKSGESTETCAGGAGKCFYGTSSCPPNRTRTVGICSALQSACCK